MERLGGLMTSCTLLLAYASLFEGLYASPVSQPPFVLSKLCKLCDVWPSECNDTEDHCMTHCNITAICEHSFEVCAGAWHRDGTSVTVETVCHDPSKPFHGVMLKDFNNRKCVMQQYAHLGQHFYICSCGDDECNDKLFFSTAETPVETSPVLSIVLLILVPVAVLVVVFLSLLYLCHSYLLAYILRLRPTELKPGFSDTCTILNIKHQLSDSVSNWLNHNAELLPVHLDEMVAKGRFASLHRAKLHQKTGDNGPVQIVAVKIFPLEEFLSWKTECEIFLDPELSHENIVHFLVAEKHLVERQLWIIMAFHTRGNLRDYLRENQLDWEELCKMGADVTRGVSHLHSDRNAVGGIKTAIAHRDLKSDNVLVKDDRSCCICDFGLSVHLDNDMSIEDLANRGQVGTTRYMAPELLESRLNLETIESFKQADVYSMALVLWEMTSRCSANGDVRDYEPPFGKMQHPCIESMRDAVIRARERPEIQLSWMKHTGVKLVCEMIEECWDHDPEARLTASCVLERFNDFSDPSFSNSIIGDKLSSPTESWAESELLRLNS